ncbi:MAG: hypothetical protein GYB21_04745 [Oceanospirillales bacterium]|nr:hypothetical protein [Oceanospirillales bacterium]
MITRFNALLAALLMACAFSAQAAQGDYTVEVLIFSQSGYGDGAAPYEPMDATPPPPAIAESSQPSPYNGLPFSQLESLPRDRFQLVDDAARLRREGYQILWHGGWYQNVSTGRNPYVRIQSGDGRVDGVIKVDRGRYLHFKPDLLLSRSAAAETASPRYRFKQSRRMRSEQLHYLDHPHFGMLVIINPLR